MAALFSKMLNSVKYDDTEFWIGLCDPSTRQSCILLPKSFDTASRLLYNQLLW